MLSQIKTPRVINGTALKRPGRTFFVDALGCITNRVDAARVQDFFQANGWTRVDHFDEAELIILMTCGFTAVSENYNIERLKALKHRKRPGAQIIVGGCLPSINKQRLSEVFDGFVFSPRTLPKLNNLIDSEIKIEQISPSTVDAGEDSLAVIRVSTGCMSQCSYCAIPFANGRTVSRSFAEIRADIKRKLAVGIKKIRFVSEDVGAYGQEQNQSIVELLRFLVDDSLDFELYLDSLNPNWFHLYQSELIQLFHSPKIAKTLSIPIQSGSDRVLKLMKREYTSSQVREILTSVYEAFPDFRLATDFIVGFPTETDEDFEKTRSFFDEYRFHHAEIFTYEERPRIAARNLEPRIPDEVKEERRQILFQDFLSKFLSSNAISSSNQLEAALETYRKLPVNFNLVLV
jgi:MiaB/RimO family radical SAM methylthiotransferase